MKTMGNVVTSVSALQMLPEVGLAELGVHGRAACCTITKTNKTTCTEITRTTHCSPTGTQI
ncbi:hypothetical protein Psi01_54650 [Planobispora siamensis]|uniref:Uncharacterized protein n=2 Tax=Planobispora siamensis TaxID=936338 RepID=A0A8J3WMP5_9ACTN|nr:hypothetical protein Psi01_54650 [Planobispora siamensis]